MEKTFCIAGPIQPEDHYHLPFRMNEAQLMQLIEQKKYFILHAPRQSGKTMAIEWLVDKLNATGTYEALYVNIEAAQADRANYVRGIATVVMRLKMGIAALWGPQQMLLLLMLWPKSRYRVQLLQALRRLRKLKNMQWQ